MVVRSYLFDGVRQQHCGSRVSRLFNTTKRIGHDFCSVWLILFLCATALLPFGSSFAKGLPFGHAQSFKNSIIGLHLGSESEPAVIIKTDHIFSDYQRRGFFRIGALPLVVFDRLNIEIHNPRKLGAALQASSEHFVGGLRQRQAVEGREFSLCFSSSDNPRLQAHRVRLESESAWELEDGLVYRTEGGPIRFRRATLITRGAKAGNLILQTGTETIRLSLLSPASADSDPPKN